MRVEIAICTWNRSRLLAGTLNSLSQLEIPGGVTCRLLIVDNNSTDDTPQTIRNFAASQAAGRFSVEPLCEKKQGHTFARNRVISAAEGELLLWSDDDCRFNAGWITNYVNAARASQFAFWGAAIIPVFEQAVPTWINENWEMCKGCFAARDLGDVACDLTDRRLPYGANFAIRTDLQKEFRFNEDLGRRERKVLGEDETDMMRRVLAAGHRGAWVPHNPVEHMIPADRMTPEYIYQYFFGQGRTLGMNDDRRRLGQIRLFIESTWNYWMYRLKRKHVPSNVWLSHMIQSALAAGRLQA
ncbi:MAG TPA: glycosyltransferase [Pirellulaceae bacterium]|nr:glycosyltransferase [Pirellulaceae bacterium]HMO93987.1 glycosyltransferase [Pirellulaceae bacterium]HMP70857.1 glycosyltransferase [Pirellulaceae bacterium]